MTYESANHSVKYDWIFDIRLEKLKKFYFSAETENVMNDWVLAICGLCDLYKGFIKLYFILCGEFYNILHADIEQHENVDHSIHTYLKPEMVDGG